MRRVSERVAVPCRCQCVAHSKLSTNVRAKMLIAQVLHICLAFCNVQSIFTNVAMSATWHILVGECAVTLPGHRRTQMETHRVPPLWWALGVLHQQSQQSLKGRVEMHRIKLVNVQALVLGASGLNSVLPCSLCCLSDWLFCMRGSWLGCGLWCCL